MNSERIRICLGFVVISLVWGSTWLMIKIGLESIPPLFSVAMRFTLAAVILMVLLWIRRERIPLDRNAVTLYLTLAILTYSFPFALVYWGEKFIGSGLASILFAVYPFVVALGSHFVLPEEKMTVPKGAGIICGFIGVACIFWSDLQWGTAATLAMIGILASTLMQGASLIVVKKMSKDISPAALSLGGMLIGDVVLYVMAFLFEDYRAINFDFRGVGSIIYLGSLGTVVTFLTYYWLLKRVEAVYLSLVSLVTPPIALFLGAAVLGERLEPNAFSGSFLILIGILMANGKDVISALRHQKQQIVNNLS